MRKNKSCHKNTCEIKEQSFRLSLLIAVIIVLSLVLVLRLAFLQLSEYRHYHTLSLKNQLRIIPIAPPRGVILDRNGVMLAENIPVHVLEIIPKQVKNLKQTLALLQNLIPSISNDDIDTFNKIRLQNRSFMPVPLKLKLTPEDVAVFAVNQYRFTGVSVKARLMRYYPLGEKFAHVLGYVGRINLQELRSVDPVNYRATNFIGKSGIEKFYENELHGQVGYELVETDASGRILRVVNKQPPLSGDKLYLSLDIRLQEAAWRALENKRGAVVVLDSRNGEVLAMVSSPAYDPNVFVSGINNADYQALANAPERPLYNRAVRGTYPPASTVKPFMGLAGIDKGYVSTSTSIFDQGSYKLPNSSHPYRDWKRTGHGVINLNRAITVSCDIYFYQLGIKMGIAVIEDTLRQFGFGQLTHVDLLEETPGIVPSPFWKRQTKGVSWYPGDTVISAIGQGFMLATPLQLANATAALSQRGQRFRPHLLSKWGSSDNNKTKKYKLFEEYPIHLKDSLNWGIVLEAMRNVIVSNEGTGGRFGRNAPYSVGAKTGTAQVYSGKQYEKKRYEDIPEALRDNSLFIAFAPVEQPQIAIAVVVENDFIASMVARKVMDAYFEKEKPQV